MSPRFLHIVTWMTHISEFATTFARLENIVYCNYKSVLFTFNIFVKRTGKRLSCYTTDVSLVSNSFKVEFLLL